MSIKYLFFLVLYYILNSVTWCFIDMYLCIFIYVYLLMFGLTMKTMSEIIWEID